MKIGIQTWGSNGDIRPMFALAEGLVKKGHKVTLAVSSVDNKNYRFLAEHLRIAYLHRPQHFDFDIQAFARKTFRMNTLQWLNTLLEAVFYPYQQEIFQTAKILCQENDLIIGHHFLAPLKLAALQQYKPFVSITLCHAMLATPNQAPFHFPNLGAKLNLLQWRLVETIFDIALKRKFGQLWRDQDGPRFEHVYTGLLNSDLLNLVAVDPVFCPKPNHWPKQHQITGFLKLSDDVEDWHCPPTLNTFLAQGDKPVYMTFGSLQQAVPEWSMNLFMEACEIANCRAIIQSSSECYPPGSRLGRIYFIGKHPHPPVFKQCAAIVHHGGAGTSHTSTRCGRPSIVIPFMDEQLFWGFQLYRQGLGPKPLPAKKATAQKLAAKIRQTLATMEFSKQAQKQAATIKPGLGVDQAITTIERFGLL